MISTWGFWKKERFANCVLWELSGACVDAKQRDIKATCIVSGDRGRPLCFLSVKEQQKALRWPVNETMVILCVHAIDDGAKPKAH